MLEERIRLADEQVELRFVQYQDSTAIRRAKAEGQKADRVGGREQSLTAADRALLAEVEVMLALDLPSAIRTISPRLRWVQAFGAGIEHMVPVLKGSAVQLTTAAGIAAPSIAEFVLARLLQVWKELREIDGRQEARSWRQLNGRKVAGKVLGIVGLGAIGTEVARRAKALDMRVVAVTATTEGRDRPAFVDAIHPIADLLTVLPLLDALVLTAASTAKTKGLIGARELAALPPGAILCNVARGPLIDEPALLESLASGELGAAVLDVANDEPLPAESQLWAAPRMYLSPHSSASSEGYVDAVAGLFVANLTRYRRALSLRNRVDLERGY